MLAEPCTRAREHGSLRLGSGSAKPAKQSPGLQSLSDLRTALPIHISSAASFIIKQVSIIKASLSLECHFSYLHYFIHYPND
jgi:hypothetical protein